MFSFDLDTKPCRNLFIRSSSSLQDLGAETKRYICNHRCSGFHFSFHIYSPRFGILDWCAAAAAAETEAD